MDTEKHQQLIPDELAGLRFDQALSKLFPDYSRSRLQQWVKKGLILVDGTSWRCRDKVSGGEMIDYAAIVSKKPTQDHGQTTNEFKAEKLKLNIIYQDEAIVVINKPAGLVVHPAAGNWSGTLLNGLLHDFPELHEIPRAGIVHRLDKLTSGLMVVARTLKSHYSLVNALQERSVGREYLAVIQGTLIAGATIDKPIGRHQTDRKRMAVIKSGKEAITHYRIEQRFRDYMLLRVKLETGRTHQIRVHMASIKHPLVGDPVYRGRLCLPAKAEAPLVTALKAFRRQALHAESLTLIHPDTKEEMTFTAPPPADFIDLIKVLEQYSPQNPD